MRSLSKREVRLQLQHEREERFVTQWPTTTKLRNYDPLEDKHSQYYFQLPSVQKHLKRLKRKMLKHQMSSDNQNLIAGIDRNFINREDKRIAEIRKSFKDSSPVHQNYFRQKRSNSSAQKNFDYNGLYRMTQTPQRYSYSSANTPGSIYPRGINANKVKTQPYFSRDSMMQAIIERRQGSRVC